jgi:hypothetical protein
MSHMPETAGAESTSPARNAGIMALLGIGHRLMPLPAPAPILPAE